MQSINTDALQTITNHPNNLFRDVLPRTGLSQSSMHNHTYSKHPLLKVGLILLRRPNRTTRCDEHTLSQMFRQRLHIVIQGRPLPWRVLRGVGKTWQHLYLLSPIMMHGLPYEHHVCERDLYGSTTAYPVLFSPISKGETPEGRYRNLITERHPNIHVTLLPHGRTRA